MYPHNGPSHSYEGIVEYSSVDSIQSPILLNRTRPRTTRSRDDDAEMTPSRGLRVRAPWTDSQYPSQATDSSRPSRCLVPQAHYPPSATRIPRPQRYRTLDDLQMTPTVRVVSQTRISQSPPRPQPNQSYHDYIQANIEDSIQARADNARIEAAECSSRPWPGRISWSDRFHLPPRYRDISLRSTYSDRLIDAYLNGVFGATLEDNLRGFLIRVQPVYRRDLGDLIRGQSIGTREEGLVRRLLVSLNCLPPEDEDADLPPYEDMWEERYDARFGWASVPDYGAQSV
jgi:hypothetical protein